MKYLLPCECGKKVEVSPAQAGGTVFCPCGKTLSVPRLKTLRELESVDSHEEKRLSEGMSPRAAVLFLGGLVVLFAVVLLVYFGQGKPIPPAKILETDIIERQIEQFSLLETYQVWEAAQRGVTTKRSFDEVYERAIRDYWIRVGVSGAVLLVGLIVVGVGLSLPKSGDAQKG